MTIKLPTPAQEGRAYVKEVVSAWHKARFKPGLDRFTDARAIHNLKIAAGRAWADGTDIRDVIKGIHQNAWKPDANPWYVDEWGRVARAKREDQEEAERKLREWWVAEQDRRLEAPVHYAQYILSEDWVNRCNKLFGRFPECAVRICGRRRWAVEVHHKTYARLGHEPAEDLVPLCRGHHEEAHKMARRFLAERGLARDVALSLGTDFVLDPGDSKKLLG